MAAELPEFPERHLKVQRVPAGASTEIQQRPVEPCVEEAAALWVEFVEVQPDVGVLGGRAVSVPERAPLFAELEIVKCLCERVWHRLV